MALTEDDKRRLLELARRAIGAKLAGAEAPSLEEPSPSLAEPRGAFVSIHKGPHLRGCMGELRATSPLWRTVLRTAAQSATGDPRFPAMEEAELPECEIEISALTPLERTSSPETLRPGVDGAYVIGRAPGGEKRSGCFLPQVADKFGWKAEEFLDALCRDKARLSAEAWRDPETEVYLFQAQVFSE